MKSVKSKLILLALAILICGLVVTNLGWKSVLHISIAKVSSNSKLQACKSCTEPYASRATSGHDEPSVLFYSKKPGSGNQMRYEITLPSEPPPSNPTTPGKSYSFELYQAFWFGMVVCDTQSYPEQSSTCLPDSDKNIVDPTISPRHPGTAYMELQFYAPGWVQRPAGNSCNMTKWCAALIIESLSENPVTGQANNERMPYVISSSSMPSHWTTSYSA